MAQHGIDAALITCNVNLIYTYGRVVSGYLYLPLNDFARLFVKRPATLEGEHVVPIRKPEQLPELIKECGLPLPKKLMLEGDELPFTEYNRLAACFPEADLLMVGVSDRSRMVNGQFETIPAVLSLLYTQRQVARQTGIVFWNLFGAMGGVNSMTRYVEKNWAGKDYTHLGFRGGKEIAKALFDALLLEKEFYDEVDKQLE